MSKTLKPSAFFRSSKRKANYQQIRKLTIIALDSPDINMILTDMHRAEAYKDKFYQLHEVLVTNMENEQILMKRARAL